MWISSASELQNLICALDDHEDGDRCKREQEGIVVEEESAAILGKVMLISSFWAQNSLRVVCLH
jgi:hypothetical protein